MNKTVLGISAFVVSTLVVIYISLGLPMPGSKSKNVTGTVVTTPKTNLVTASPSVAGVKSYTLSEVAKHRSETDCWMAIDGSVYDVSNFSTEHPGGQMDLLSGCGIDATELYTTGKAGRHHERATAILLSYKIGTLQ